jgi:probable F420-dependent oxidoreductase
MEFGIHLPHAGRHATAAGILAVAKAAEAAGYGSVWLYDHLVTPTTSASAYPFTVDGRYPLAPEDPYFDAVGVMGALAGATERIQFGVRVLVPALRHPVVLAKELATIDALAGGRMTLCVGGGWMAEEFAAVGVPMDRRFARMDEHVAVMRNAWTNGVAGFAGEFYGHVEAGFHPRPPRGTIPILVGGYTDAALRRVARYGDGWAALVRSEETIGAGHQAAPVEALAARLEKLRELCAETGRRYEDLTIVAQASTKDSLDTLRGYAELGVHACDLVIWGDADRVIREADAFANRVGTTLGPATVPAT